MRRLYPNDDLIRAQNGDTKAFDRLVAPLIQPLYKTMYLLTRDQETAEDIVQETMYQSYIHIRRFDPKKASLSTWMRKIAFRQAGKIYRKTVKNDVYEEGSSSDSSGSAETYEEDEVWIEIAKLTEPLRAVIILFYYEELSIKEISHTLEISEGTVKSRLNHGREKLKERLEQKKERDI